MARGAGMVEARAHLFVVDVVRVFHLVARRGAERGERLFFQLGPLVRHHLALHRVALMYYRRGQIIPCTHPKAAAAQATAQAERRDKGERVKAGPMKARGRPPNNAEEKQRALGWCGEGCNAHLVRGGDGGEGLFGRRDVARALRQLFVVDVGKLLPVPLHQVHLM